MMKYNKGLTQRESDEALLVYGPNEIEDTNKVTPIEILLRQIKKNYIIYLLAVTAIISFVVGKYATSSIIFVVIFLVIITGFIQEYKSEKAISSLKKMVTSILIAIRDGKRREVRSQDIVPGDVLMLVSGDRVPADAVILSEAELRVNESMLTGESKEIAKTVSEKCVSESDQKIKEKTDIPEKDSSHYVFMGTYIVNGKAYVRVIATGMRTRFGNIAGIISETEKELPLQKKVNTISKYMVVVAIVMSLLTGSLMLSRAYFLDTETVINILIVVIAMSVAAFPEGFPVVLITTLSAGTMRMAKKNAIVNRMSIIETLGETTVICSDKTGTLTRGEMTIQEVHTMDNNYAITGSGYVGHGKFFKGDNEVKPSDYKDLLYLIRASVVANDAQIERTGEDMTFSLHGTPTEGALLIMGVKANIYAHAHNARRITEMPFSSERKMMSVLVKEGSEYVVYAKGAPDVILEKCDYVMVDGEMVKMTPRMREKILQINKNMSRKALRTLAIAYKIMSEKGTQYREESLVYLGVVGMEDPPRKYAKESIEACMRAGIKVKMITGDGEDTASAIAKEIGLKGEVMLGKHLDALTDSELKKKIDNISVFARVRPEHKLRIVTILKKKGEIVTMTGDGVNDAPALKGAHIGIAMGKNGTDVSRSVADLTLRDDNFVTIVSAIREGRTIFNNIKKFVSYQLSCNLAELLVLFVGTLFAPWLGWDVPLFFALHILFMNLVTDNLPAITLGLNRASKDILSDPPRKNSNILTRPLFLLMIVNGLLMGIMTLIVYYISFNMFGEDVVIARTTALATLIMLEIASAFNFRSFRYGVFTRSLFVNKYLVYASIVSVIATFAIFYTPLAIMFDTYPISLTGWGKAIIFMVAIVVIFDIVKFYSNKKNVLMAHLR